MRDFFQFHFSSHAWLPALLGAVAITALLVLLFAILFVRPGPNYVPSQFRQSLAYTAVICWAVSILAAYAGGLCHGSHLRSQIAEILAG